MKNWYCIYTKSRYEDHVADRLRYLPGIEVLNPKIKARRYSRGKVKRVTEDLFPCYIFSRFNPSQYLHMVKYTRGVKRVVGDTIGTPYVVDDELVRQIQSRIHNGFVQIEEEEFREGDTVEILDGPFRGLEGVFQGELKARDRVMVLLNAITYQAVVEVEKGLLSRV